MKKILIYAVLFLVSAVATASNGASERWEAGNKAYMEGDYKKAVEEYRAIIDGGEYSAKLYFNLANAYFTQAELEQYFPDGNACIADLDSAESWDKFLLELGSKNITAVLLEGGGVLAGNALRNKVVDYVEFHIAPKLLAGRGRPVVGGEAPELMSQALDLENVEVKTYGNDIAVCGYLKNSR